ncbi:hypothetical protein ASZ90_003574 [hydrocarbon metagenome]|uniref:Secretion system C-terminal sorting domain-containing protein n=1 Tax=hydrocarbon metagenome TaxID=938273 RepID=A0A0W8G0H6_9ZZZZ
MKKVLLAAFLFSFIITSFSQTQEKIPWYSLADSPWPVARGDVQGTGRSEYIGPKVPEVKWKKSYPFGMVEGPVIGSEGQLYFGTFGVNNFHENYFYAADTNGDQLWRFETDDFRANDCAPAVGWDGTIYFGSDNGNFYALNSDGTLKWKYFTNEAVDVSNMVLDKEGNTYVGTPNSLFSFDVYGTLRFKLELPSVIGGTLVFSPSGDTLYTKSRYYTGSDYIHHLNALNTNGEVLWRKQFEELSAHFMVDNSNKIYVQGELEGNRAIYCLNSDGTVNWSYNENGIPSVYASGPTIDKNGNIIFNASIQEPRATGIVSLDYNGSLNWIFIFESEPWFFLPYEEISHGLVCDADGTIYAASGWGHYLYAISKDGELLWKLRLNEDMWVDSGPIIGGDGLIYLGMHRGAFAHELEDNLWAIGEKTTSVEEDELPSEYKLEQNYPNPFNPSTTIKFSLPERSEVKLSIFNLLGQEIKMLFHGEKESGSYEYVFENKSLSTGVYFYVLESQQVRLSRKMMLIK